MISTADVNTAVLHADGHFSQCGRPLPGAACTRTAWLGLSLVVARGVLATAKDNVGNQLLHGDCGVHELQWLHEQGVSLTAENDMGERPMDTAARANAYEIIGWLGAHGVALTARAKQALAEQLYDRIPGLFPARLPRSSE